MKRFSIRGALSYIIPLALFAAMIVWFLLAMRSADSSTKQRELSALKATVENGVTMCYAIEGAYPENVEYLMNNYGLVYDKDKYIVDYDCFADNIRPTVNVIERQAAK
ncbi:MAG: hypothetical protein K2N38_14490 [Oscillospiraceae bacterium]|nr:hypothetical protein [Oscillospiraceae bacterium]